ncbi:MAG: DNA polymerase III subunit delta' [Candidatus Omnitrophica bacterium]|nr:DNA polymerase III subunit delta' [Candidatus Omnitrophota bacterium]
MAWSDILGHESAKRFLQTHLATGAVPNAYLFAGPDGVGKRRLALEMAKALNCDAPGARPCDHCPSCARFGRGAHPDLHLLSPSGASNQIKMEDIRMLLGRVALRPFSAPVQVAILDGTDRLTEEAANSLLKVLEEPSVHTKFLLMTSRLSFCLPTIVSRCQLVRCSALPAEVMTRLLIQQHGCDASVAGPVSQLAGGSLARAADLAGRWRAYGQVCARLADTGMGSWLEQPLPETRESVAHLLEAMLSWLRDVTVAAVEPSHVAHAAHAEALRRQAAVTNVERCVDAALELHALRESLDQFVSPRLVAALAREKWLSLTSV